MFIDSFAFVATRTLVRCHDLIQAILHEFPTMTAERTRTDDYSMLVTRISELKGNRRQNRRKKSHFLICIKKVRDCPDKIGKERLSRVQMSNGERMDVPPRFKMGVP